MRVKIDIDTKNQEPDDDREFQLQMLRVQLKHEREVARFTVLLAIGAAFIIFALQSVITAQMLNVTIPAFSLLGIVLIIYAIAALFCFIGGVCLIGRIKSSEEIDLDEIRRKFNIKKKDC